MCHFELWKLINNANLFWIIPVIISINISEFMLNTRTGFFCCLKDAVRAFQKAALGSDRQNICSGAALRTVAPAPQHCWKSWEFWILVVLQVVQPVARLAYVNPATNQIISLPPAHHLLNTTGFMLGIPGQPSLLNNGTFAWIMHYETVRYWQRYRYAIEKEWLVQKEETRLSPMLHISADRSVDCSLCIFKNG